MKLVCHYFAIFSRPVLCLFPPSGHCSMPFPINPGRFSENYRPLTQNSKYEETSLQKNNKKNMKAASSKQIPSWFQNSNNQQLKQKQCRLQPSTPTRFSRIHIFLARDFCHSWLSSKPRCNLFPKFQGPPRLWTSLPGREEIEGGKLESMSQPH